MLSGNDEAETTPQFGPPGRRAAGPPGRRAADVVALVAVLVGAVVRLRQWGADRSLWLDEAMLADNVIHRSLGGLARPLSLDQAAPLGFLWATKLVTLAAGTGERALRLVPLLAGLATLPALWLLARRATGCRWAAALATALLAASLEATRYAVEFKPYGLDLLVAIVVPLLALRLLDAPTRRGRWAALLLAGVGFLLVSYTAAFVLGGTGLVLAAVCVRRRQWPAVAASAGVGVAWLGTFLLLWTLFYRQSGGNRFLNDYWHHAFLTIPPQSGEDVRGLVAAFYSLLEEAFSGPPMLLGDRFAGVLVAGGVVGAAAMLGRGRRAAMAMLWLPVGLLAAASAMRLYPFRDRLILFTAAATLVTVAAGFGRTIDLLLLARQRRTSLALAAGLLALPAACLLATIARPLELQEMRPLLNRIAPLMGEKDFVYRHVFAEPAWDYYAPAAGLADRPGAAGRRFLNRGTWAGLGREVRLASGARRVWVISVQPDLWDGEADLPRLFAELDRRGRLVREVRETGAEARLYEFPPAATRPATRP